MGKQWWKDSVVYQIYPRSFNDSNGDGVGDIKGITEKLDYLKELGIDVVWLSPVYQSPNDDNGYDISNYREVMDEFGTMADWEEMLAGMHNRGIRLVMDLVVNHSSDEHAWFAESRKSKDNPYRDYYIWRASENGHEPNNWGSIFGGSAWQYDEATDEYYLHLFSKKQPDLNWENPKLREEVYDVMKFWLDKGVDGFRMDVINFISKDPNLPDAEKKSPDKYQWGGDYFVNGPKFFDYMKDMNEKVLKNYNAMTVGEMPLATPEDGVKYTDEEDGIVSMLFQFEHMDVTNGPGGKWDQQPWKLTDLKKIISKWQTELHGKGWNSLYMENHDQPRSVSVFGDDGTYRVASAKMLAAWLHLLQGTPYIYQGQELAMTNVYFDRIEDYEDIETLNMYNEEVKEKGKDHAEILEAIHKKGRDNARTPMQWSDEKHAGFTTGTPWLNVNPNYTEVNAKKALRDKNSVFYFYKELIRLRKEYDIIVHGDYKLLLEDDEQLYVYKRKYSDQTLVVAANFSSDNVILELDELLQGGSLLISNYEETTHQLESSSTMRPYEVKAYLFYT
ncbi:glycoside hydrolase family 13 protein [Guptibacillus algicola]|uniref:glycoside hydrolase family 13 protein n=1 Tax=Guptibacillus algicola TaxID=225844 RepID=UPI001CD1A5FD|nr:alpha-glucosidase [Alkalihalobacillus algicola]MCA0989158.1 alpha-glucosidase [Alkalihalobacillus algicola]